MPGVWPAPEFVWDEIGVTPLAVDSCALAPDLQARWNGYELLMYYRHGIEAIFFDFENNQVREIPSSPEE
jgi:hypothetical protein